jgi:hypothetical protein
MSRATVAIYSKGKRSQVVAAVSVVEDCHGCRYGRHDEHDPDWGACPGLSGGVRCGCVGDCKQRLRERTRQVQP